MMAKVHEIGVGADTRAFEDQIKSGVIDPTQDAQKALERLADATGEAGSASGKAGGQVDSFADKLAEAARKAGKSDDEIRDALRQMNVSADEARRAVDKLGDQFKDTGRDGERGVDKLEDALKDVQQQSEKTEKAVKDIGDGGAGGFAKIKSASAEASDELKQNLGETMSSFRGDLEDIPQIAQDVFGGLAGSVGGLPAAMGLAAGAAGIGVLIDSFMKVQEAANDAKDSAFDMAYSVGGAIDAAGYSARLAQWTSDTEKWKQANDIAQATGWDVVDVVDAMASGGDKLDALTASWGDGADAAWLTGQRLYELEAVLKATNEGYASGAEAADINAMALGNYAQQAGLATGKVDDLGNAIYLLPDGTEVSVDANTGKATTDINNLGIQATTLPDGTVKVTAITAGLQQVRVDLDALTKPRTITIQPKVLDAVGATRSWDK